MKAYGLDGVFIRGGNNWKKDYHCHDKNHRKIGNWWENFSSNPKPRTTIKNEIIKEIEKEIKMTKEDLVKEVIELTLREVRDQGWDLLDASTSDGIEMVYNKIKGEL